MSKIKNYLNKPITRGDILKESMWSLAISAAMWGGLYVYSLYSDRKHYRELWLESMGELEKENPLDDPEMES